MAKRRARLSLRALSLAIGTAALIGALTVPGSAQSTSGKGSSVVRATREAPDPKADLKKAPPADAAAPAAKGGAAPLAKPSADLDQGVAVTSAERLSIKFEGYENLTNEYRIGADNAISIPVVGRISVAGMSTADLEAALAARVSAISGREAYVTVEISEYRSIYIVGYVSRPGAFPWRPGMAVVQAMALAGGTFRASDSPNNAANEHVELSHVKKLISELKWAHARLARYEAEKRGEKTITAPKALVKLVGAEHAAHLIKTENSSLTSRSTAFKAKKEAIANATEIASRELSGLVGQAGRLKVQLDERRTYKQQIDGLRAKGVVRADRSMEEQTRLSELEERHTNVAVAIARIQGVLAGLERDRISLEQDRNAEIDTEISRLMRDIGQTEIDLQAGITNYQNLTGRQAPLEDLLSDHERKPVLSYRILRHSGSGNTQATLPADPMTALKPGDVLMVAFE